MTVPAAARRSLRPDGPRAGTRALWVCAGLFALRVAAQPASRFIDSPLVPPFEAWHSGTLPYPWLVASQGLLLAGMIWAALGVTQGSTTRRPRAGKVLRLFSAAYFVGMLARLLLGTTVLADSRWFASPIPTMFHLVIAVFLWMYAAYHLGDHAGGRSS